MDEPERGTSATTVGGPTSDISIINLPALSFSGDWVSAFNSLDSLRTANRLGLKRRSQQHRTIIDSESNQFEVLGLRKIRLLWSSHPGNIVDLIFGNPSFEVELTLSAPSKASLHEVKARIEQCFQHHEDFWEEMCDFDQFRRSIARARSITQIFDTFRKFNQL